MENTSYSPQYIIFSRMIDGSSTIIQSTPKKEYTYIRYRHWVHTQHPVFLVSQKYPKMLLRVLSIPWRNQMNKISTDEPQYTYSSNTYQYIMTLGAQFEILCEISQCTSNPWINFDTVPRCPFPKPQRRAAPICIWGRWAPGDGGYIEDEILMISCLPPKSSWSNPFVLVDAPVLLVTTFTSIYKSNCFPGTFKDFVERKSERKPWIYPPNIGDVLLNFPPTHSTTYSVH